MSDGLDGVSAELLARIDKQQTLLPRSGPTHELGGIARASALLEKFLRLVLNDMADMMNTTADALISRTGGGSVRLGKATGGRLLKALALLAQEPASARPCVRMIIKEAAKSSNRILRVVEVRNKVIHGTEEPESARVAVAELRGFIEAYRRDARWDSPSPKQRGSI